MSATHQRTRASAAARSDRVARWERRSQAWASSVVHLLVTTALLFLLACVVAGTALFAL